MIDNSFSFPVHSGSVGLAPNGASSAPALFSLAAEDLQRLDALARRLRPLAGSIALRDIQQRLMRELLAAAAQTDAHGPLAEIRDGLLRQASVATRRWLKSAVKKDRAERARGQVGRVWTPGLEEALCELLENEAVGGPLLSFAVRHQVRRQ